jgi:hypothetical protein
VDQQPGSRQLLSGTNLIYLLKEHAQVDAKIEPPEHWADPKFDTGPTHWDEPPSASSPQLST